MQDNFSDPEELRTQVLVLRSSSLLQRTVRELELYKYPEFDPSNRDDLMDRISDFKHRTRDFGSHLAWASG